MDLWDVGAMTALHFVLFPVALGVLAEIPALRRWMRGRLEP
jgi:hypothetical protein